MNYIKFIIYIVVAIIAVFLSAYRAYTFSWFLILEFFVGISQIIGSVIRYIIYLKYKNQDGRNILQYWVITCIYLVLAKIAAIYYEYNVTDFDSSINYDTVILSLAWPIAFWYMFNISFLKSKQA
jgi:hypothetical protein